MTPVYAVYGVRLATTHPFAFRMAPSSGPADVTFDVVEQGPLPDGWDQGAWAYEAASETGERVGGIVLHQEWIVARFFDRADFFIGPGRILCHLHDPAYEFAVEIWLLGTAFALWLEARGVPTLHAASVDVAGRAIGFLSTNKGGKSSLAATFVRSGDSLLGDDILALEREPSGGFLARPGYPQMRFWPDQARLLLGSDAGLERVQPGSTKLRVPIGPPGFGTFTASPRPLAALYLPERDGSASIEIEPIPLAMAVTELVRHSFLPGVLEALGMTKRRFVVFAELLRRVPVRRLRYPSGLEHLPAVREALLRDLGEGVEPLDR